MKTYSKRRDPGHVILVSRMFANFRSMPHPLYDYTIRRGSRVVHLLPGYFLSRIFRNGSIRFPPGSRQFYSYFVNQQFLANYGVDRSKVKIERYGYAIACQKTTKDETSFRVFIVIVFFSVIAKLERLRDSWNDCTIVEDNWVIFLRGRYKWNKGWHMLLLIVFLTI